MSVGTDTIITGNLNKFFVHVISQIIPAQIIGTFFQVSDSNAIMSENCFTYFLLLFGKAKNRLFEAWYTENNANVCSFPGARDGKW